MGQVDDKKIEPRSNDTAAVGMAPIKVNLPQSVTQLAPMGRPEVVPQPTANSIPSRTEQTPPASSDRGAASAVHQKPPERTKPRCKVLTNSTKKSPEVRNRYVRQADLDIELTKLETLSQAALNGDTRALDGLRAGLDKSPHIRHRLADLQLQIEARVVDLIEVTDPLRIEAFRKHWSECRRNLLDGQAASSFATKMAASRVQTCWLFVQLLEVLALKSPVDSRMFKSLEQAERRYQIAMRTFLLARRSDAHGQ